MSGIVKQIIGSFEDIGKDVARETIKAPTELAAKTLESLGMQNGTKGSSGINSGNLADSRNLNKEGPLGQFAQAKDVKTKQTIARAALEYLARKPMSKEPSVWERREAEEAQKKEQVARQAQIAAASQLPNIKSNRPKGDRYGVFAKQTAAERKLKGID